MICPYHNTSMQLNHESKHRLDFSCSHLGCAGIVYCYDERNNEWFIAHYFIPFKYNGKKINVYSSCLQNPSTIIFGDDMLRIISVNRFFEIKADNLDVTKIVERLLNLKAFS